MKHFDPKTELFFNLKAWHLHKVNCRFKIAFAPATTLSIWHLHGKIIATQSKANKTIFLHHEPHFKINLFQS